MAEKTDSGDTTSSSNSEAMKRVEVIMGERPPAPGQSVPSTPPIDIFKETKADDQLKSRLSKTEPAQSAPDAGSKPVSVSNTTEPAPSEALPVDSAAKQSVNIDDEATEQAIKGIIAEESDVVLAATTPAFQPPPKAPKQRPTFKEIMRNKWTWIIVVCLCSLVFIVPYTRYTILGLFIHKNISITVQDSKLHTAVSGAEVTVDGSTAKTDQNGVATVRAALGKQKVTVSKQYFTTYNGSTFVGLTKAKSQAVVNLVATGRQIPLMVLDTITHRPVSGATVSASGTTAKTNSQGKVTIVLPASKDTVDTTITLSGYITLHTSIDTTTTDTAKHTYYLVPSGKIYFLSNRSGKIDVVKSNLDGSDRQTVVPGTGNEDPNSTSLLATRDWKYLVLKAKRDTAQPSLYLIDTSTDKVTTFDSGDAMFTLIGWSNHRFMYDVLRNTVSSWQSGKESIKAYDADHGQLNQLDQNQAEGTSTSYINQGFSQFQVFDGALVYAASWYTYSNTGTTPDLTNKKDAIRRVQSTGDGKTDLQSFDASTTGYIQSARYGASEAYYSVYNNADTKTSYYNYANQNLTPASNVDQSAFNKSYPVYLFSPSATQTFWSDFRDGKNTLFMGDADAKNAKELPTQSDYTAYGWYTTNYVLVSKNNSELYIMSAMGLPTGTQPLKITDYYKPANTYPGYGYGYGGL